MDSNSAANIFCFLELRGWVENFKVIENRLKALLYTCDFTGFTRKMEKYTKKMELFHVMKVQIIFPVSKVQL